MCVLRIVWTKILSIFPGLCSGRLGGAEVETEVKNKTHWSVAKFFLCRCWFSIGNVWLAVQAELSKCKCYWVQALWAEPYVAYSSFHISNVGFVVATNVLCNVDWLPARQSAHTHLVWGIAPLLCWNVLLRLFTEYSNLQRSTEVKKKKICWYLNLSLHSGIIYLEKGLCNGCRQLLVIWRAQMKSNTKSVGKYHSHLI